MELIDSIRTAQYRFNYKVHSNFIKTTFLESGELEMQKFQLRVFHYYKLYYYMSNGNKIIANLELCLLLIYRRRLSFIDEAIENVQFNL